jgi:predicted nucleic acid-binding protein
MRYLLDTSVLIDVAREVAAPLRWWTSRDARDLFTSTITVGELYRGAHLRHGREPARLLQALREIEEEALGPLRGRVLDFDRPAAVIWGRLMGDGQAQGRRPAIDDAKIAAIALAHGMDVATSNPRDFASLCPTIDPRTA